MSSRNGTLIQQPRVQALEKNRDMNTLEPVPIDKNEFLEGLELCSVNTHTLRPVAPLQHGEKDGGCQAIGLDHGDRGGMKKEEKDEYVED